MMVQQENIIEKVFNLSKSLNQNDSNFIQDEEGIYDKNCKMIVRNYATLLFIMMVDDDESELGILDLIQIIVEALDKIFINACELDTVYFPSKVNQLVDEIIVGGIVIETNLNDIIENFNQIQMLQELQN